MASLTFTSQMTAILLLLLTIMVLATDQPTQVTTTIVMAAPSTLTTMTLTTLVGVPEETSALLLPPAIYPCTSRRYELVPGPSRPSFAHGRAPRTCGEHEKMALDRYKYAVKLCHRSQMGGLKETARIMEELRGFDFRRYCGGAPPVGCCCDVKDILQQDRCRWWWPSATGVGYYEGA